jgi:hypothetical protein
VEDVRRAYRRTPRGKELKRECDKRYIATPNGKAARLRITKRHQRKYPAATAARAAVSKAIRKGTLHKQPCAVCGSVKVHAHHRDYGKPLVVVWLCDKHHRHAHKR